MPRWSSLSSILEGYGKEGPARKQSTETDLTSFWLGERYFPDHSP
jgi:hypothetical protein